MSRARLGWLRVRIGGPPVNRACRVRAFPCFPGGLCQAGSVRGLLAQFRIGAGDVVSLVGAGGKTTLLGRLAAEARQGGLRVIVTSTTHMGAGRPPGEPILLDTDPKPLARLDNALRTQGHAIVLGRRIRPDKIRGLPPGQVDGLRGMADLILVEADGARGRSLKVPAAYEPVLPPSSTAVIVVAGIDVLGSSLDEERVHRVELLSSATATARGALVDEQVLVSALRFPAGYLARVPPHARCGVFLNKVEGPDRRAVATRIARALAPPYAFVAAGSARGGPVELWP